MHQVVELRWKTGSAAGYADVFPAEDFSVEVSGFWLLHQVRGPHGGIHHARCRLKIAGQTATLDYGAFADFNLRNGMEIGVLRFDFADRAKGVVREVWWNQKPVPDNEATVTIETSKGFPSTVDGPVSRQQTMARQALRPGQAEFRQRLDLIYSGRCCVSGCLLPWALQAAHIRPFKDAAASNSPANGLLLRADFHFLFDSNQMAIHPKSRLVIFSPEARVWTEYSKLHRRERLADPQPPYGKHAPPNAAFKSRWIKFVQAHGIQNGVD